MDKEKIVRFPGPGILQRHRTLPNLVCRRRIQTGQAVAGIARSELLLLPLDFAAGSGRGCRDETIVLHFFAGDGPGRLRTRGILEAGSATSQQQRECRQKNQLMPHAQSVITGQFDARPPGSGKPRESRRACGWTQPSSSKLHGSQRNDGKQIARDMSAPHAAIRGRR
jgi:hypothetical protein